ncbi:MAG: MmgE/PrpD family protein, partial [Proteobacteria bacterium]|nr:MmgE/PrpD family protein [Burkholderiales bacterium]
LALAAGPGPALVFGGRERASVLDAALINGVSSHVLDFDDCNNTIGGHPSVPILPGLIALAERERASGRDLLVAYVAGFETETRIARAVHFHHYEKGWHPTATLGVFGAAAAAARLLALDAERTATALAIAASLAAGIKANFGTMVKSLHVGQCARNGLYAALLASHGYTANAGVFEHPQGFFEVFNGAGHYDAAKALADWGEPFDIVSPGIAIKQYPCCGSTHPALDAMLAIVRRHPLAGVDIARIEAWIHPRRLAHTDRPHPASALDCKFSLQYCLVRALLDRQVVLEQFDGEGWRDARVGPLLERVTVAPYDGSRFDPANHFGGEVRVTLHDGRVLQQKVEQPLGRTSANPLPEALLHAKFAACAQRVLPAPRTEQVVGSIAQFEALADVRAFTTLLEP